MFPDNSKGQKSANSESDSGSSEELIEDIPDCGQRPKSSSRSVPRRERGKQKDRRRHSEPASSSRDRPVLPITESGNESTTQMTVLSHGQ